MRKTRSNLSNLEVANALGAISQIERYLTGIDIKFYLAENSKSLRELVQSWSEHRESIAKEHANLDEEGKPKTRVQGAQEMYDWKSDEDKESGTFGFKELDNVEVEVSAYNLPLSRLKKAEKEDSRIAIASLSSLLWMIRDDTTNTSSETIKVSNIDAANSVAAIGALDNHIAGIVAKYALAQNSRALSKALRQWTDTREQIVKDHAKHDDDGVAMTEVKNGQEVYVWKSPDSKTTALDLIKKNDDTEIEVKTYPIPLSLLMEADKPDSSAPIEAFEAILWLIKMDTGSEED